MKTNLAEVAQIADAAIANENKHPVVDDESIRTTVVGFNFIDATQRQSVIRSRRAAIKKFQTDAAAVTELLGNTYGVDPLAVLPTKMFTQMCDDAGLYRFKPNTEGQITVTLRDLHYFELFAAITDVLFWLAPPALYLYVITNLIPWGPWDAVTISTGVIGIAIGLMYVVFFNMETNPYIEMHGIFTQFYAGWLNHLSHETVARRLIKGLTAEAEAIQSGASGNEHKAMATLILPEPPEDVADVLLKLRSRGDLQVAVVTEAFRFAETPASYFRQEIDRRVARRNAHWQTVSVWPDPIVYLEQGTATAVVCQFGDFPIERELVERICATSHLLV